MMTLQQVTEYLNCHATTVYRLLRQREIPGFKFGRGWRFRRSDLEQWIRDRQSKPEPPSELKRKSMSRWAAESEKAPARQSKPAEMMTVQEVAE
jgi:excisionase family DNA binding protein